MSANTPLPAIQWLQTRPQWVCWRTETRDKGKPTKVPYNPRTRQRAESDNPDTWAAYNLAVQAYKRSRKTQRPYDGLGFVFLSDGHLSGIDLDHCIAPDGTVDAWAQEWIERLQSYTEYSPSGEGFHIYVVGIYAKPSGDKCLLKGKRHPKAAIEVYSERHYFTVTGRHVEGTPTTIEARQDALDALYQHVCTLKEASAQGRKGTLSREASTVPLDDELLLKKAGEARNGEKFRALFYNGPQGYPSPSEADLALCLMLAFWTGRDQARMDRLYRQSALYRERDKWDSARRESTYGQETIRKAAALCTVAYDPRRTYHQLERDIEQLLQHIAQQQTHVAQHQGRSQGSRKGKPHQLAPKEVATSQVLAYLDMNEYGDALFFAEVFAGQVCYDHSACEWYLWDGHAWKRDATGKVRHLVAGVLGTLYLRAAADLNPAQAELDLQMQALQRDGVKETDARMSALKEQYKALAGQISELRNRARGLRSAMRMSNVLKFVQSAVGITSEMWDSHPWLLAVPNGVLDLQTGTCRDGEPADYLRTVAPTEWNGLDTPCPRFERYLQEIFEDKPDRDTLIAFLQRLLGYAITGLTTHHLFPILYGQEGRNGKDTLLELLKAVLGALVGAVSNVVFIAQGKLRSAGAATPHLVDLQGKRLVWGSETKEGDRLNIAQIKLLTGGGEISARQLHGHQYTFTPTHKLLLMTNYKPHADSRDKAFWSRACLIEFGLRFVEQPHATNERLADLTLRDTLKQECSGILAWLVRGCLIWQEQGLNIPESVRLATDKYRDEEDRLLLFIAECCIVTPQATVRAGALYEAYKTWCEQNQFGKGMNGKLFGDEMGKRFEKKRITLGLIYQGIGLLSSDPDPRGTGKEQEKHVGSMYGHEPSMNTAGLPSEANPEGKNNETNVGYVGLRQVFSQNDIDTPFIEAKTWNSPTYPTYSPPVDTSQSAPEADAHATSDQKAPYIDPTFTVNDLTYPRCMVSQMEPAPEAACTRCHTCNWMPYWGKWATRTWGCGTCHPEIAESLGARYYPDTDTPEKARSTN